MSIEATLQRIERKLDRLSNPKPKWVRASIITELTGWNNQKMRSARINDLIVYKKEENSYWYDLNSLHPLLIKKKQAE